MKLKTLGQTLNINDDYIKDNPEKCSKIKKQLIRIKSEFEKPKIAEAYPVSRYPIMTIPFELVSVGEHEETEKWIANDGKEYSCNNMVTDYKVIGHDCLPGKAWVEAHYQDEYPEPMIELGINGKHHKLNGNYKHGVIRQLIKS